MALLLNSSVQRLEVDGVGQHQVRVGIQHAGSQQILDLVFRLLFDPAVDIVFRAASVCLKSTRPNSAP